MQYIMQLQMKSFSSGSYRIKKNKSEEKTKDQIQRDPETNRNWKTLHTRRPVCIFFVSIDLTLMHYLLHLSSYFSCIYWLKLLKLINLNDCWFLLILQASGFGLLKRTRFNAFRDFLWRNAVLEKRFHFSSLTSVKHGLLPDSRARLKVANVWGWFLSV